MHYFIVAYLTLLFSVTGFVWINKLSEPNMIFDFAPFLFQKYVSQNPKINIVLFQCSACFSGQMALWLYYPAIKYVGLEYHFYDHFSVIIFSIFINIWLDKSYNQ